MTVRPVLVALGLAGMLGACSGQAEPDPLAERGRQVYLGQCMVCHGPDPTQSGPIGPSLKGSSPALVEAKVLRGEYPPDYAPKRPSQVMLPMPALAPDIPALAAYLE